MKATLCLGLAILAGAAVAQDHRGNDRGSSRGGSSNQASQGRSSGRDSNAGRSGSYSRDNGGGTYSRDNGRQNYSSDRGRSYGGGWDRRDDHRDWDDRPVYVEHDRDWSYRPVYDDAPLFGINLGFGGGDVFVGLTAEIGDLQIQLDNYRHSYWGRDRDYRIHNLEARIAADHDRLRHYHH